MKKPDACMQCPMYGRSHGYVKPFGSCRNKVMIVSDFPEVDEIHTQVPLSDGRAGDMMRRVFQRVKERREDYGIRYLVHCTPFHKQSNQRLELSYLPHWKEAADYCNRVHLDSRGSGRWKPEVVVPLGATALEYYTGLPANDRCRGYVYKGDGTPVLGTYHPFMVGGGNTGLLFTMRYDLANAKTKSKSSWGGAEKKFVEDPSPEEFSDMVDGWVRGSKWLVVDIETPYGGDDESEYSKKQLSFQILRCSFTPSHDTDLAVSIQWDASYFPAVRRLLASDLDKVYWNGDYDAPRLRHNGFELGGKFVDAMWLWHFLQPDLPKALAHVATYFTELPEWKSTSVEEPAYYSCCDSYGEAKCYEGILKSLEEKGMLELAERHVTQLLILLNDAKLRGMQVNPVAVNELRSSLEEKLDEWDKRIKVLYPDTIKRTKWYKRPPVGVKRGEIAEGTRAVIGKHDGRYIKDGEVWGFREDFNPNSTTQLKDYLRHRGIKIPRKRRTGRETTDAKSLKHILAYNHDPLIREILDRAASAKVYSTYTSWPIDSENRVHPTMSMLPATGRLNCFNPNFQNIPKEGELARMVRECIVASEGCELVAADYTGMESYLTGFFADDAEYMLLSTMNIYAYIVAKHQGWELPDVTEKEDLKKALAKYKKRAKESLKVGEIWTLYDKFKKIVLALGYGAGRNTIFENNPGVFKNLAEAGKLREFVFKTFPKLEEWQENVRYMASKGYLINPFGYVRHFMDCPGADSNKALAQLPQSTGGAIVRECILQIADTWLINHWVLQVHDELVFDVPKDRIKEACLLIRGIMEQEWPQLGGHSISINISRGLNLAEMEDHNGS